MSRSFMMHNIQRPPRSPTSQAQHPEQPSKIDNSIDALLADFHLSITQQQRQDNSIISASISELYDQLAKNASKVLDQELPYEDAPGPERRIRCETSVSSWLDSCNLAQSRWDGRKVQDIEDDGLILVAHVASAEEPILNWSLGFIIRTTDGTDFAVSCSHTLESAAHYCRSRNPSSSSTFIVTRNGHIYPIASISTSLPLHDIAIYPLSSRPCNIAPNADASSPRSVPIGLYPAPVGTEQSIFLAGNDEWKKCKVVGYKDPRGNDVEPGTYDELNSLSIDVLPVSGSSGGPLVSAAGAVTGLIRGSRLAYGDKRSVGFATPAEKIFELFQLPGLGKKSGPAASGFVHHY